jgi:hypothetical protein
MTNRSHCTPARQIDPPELEFWKRRLDDIPDLRWDKVVSIRKAICRDRYDTNEGIEGMLAMLGNEVGVLCRRENMLLHDDPTDADQSSR